MTLLSFAIFLHGIAGMLEHFTVYWLSVVTVMAISPVSNVSIVYTAGNSATGDL